MTFDPAKFRTSAQNLLAPSVRDIIFIFLFWSLLAGTLSNRPLADPDIGWHIRTGELILQTHTPPRVDHFSSTMQGQTWYAWEWLYDAALGVLDRACGLDGVVWLCAVLVSTTLILLFSQLLRRGTGFLFSVILMLLAEAAGTVHLYARPHVASWLLSLLWLLALEKWQISRPGTVPAWLLWFFPVSMVLWVNLHAGWIFGMAMLAIYAFSTFIEGLRAPDAFSSVNLSYRARSMTQAFALAAAATFVNPYTWHLHVHIYRYLTNRYLMNHIAEFHSPDFHGWSQRCFAGVLLATLLALAIRGSGLLLSHRLMILLAAYAGLFASRNIPVSSFVLVLMIGPLLWQSFTSLADSPGAWGWVRTSVSRIAEFSDRMQTRELELRGHLWPIAFVVAALAVCLQGGRLGSRQLVHAHFDSKAVPVAAADFLTKHQGTTPIFSTDSWGGYLIYRLYPERQVVVDDRHDLYGSGRVREILILMQAEPGWRDVLEKWHLQTILLPVNSTLANLLLELPQDWQVTYRDNLSILLEKRPSPGEMQTAASPVYSHSLQPAHSGNI